MLVVVFVLYYWYTVQCKNSFTLFYTKVNYFSFSKNRLLRSARNDALSEVSTKQRKSVIARRNNEATGAKRSSTKLNLRLAIRDTKLFFYRKMQSYRIAQLGIMADNHIIFLG